MNKETQTNSSENVYCLRFCRHAWSYYAMDFSRGWEDILALSVITWIIL